MIAALTSSDLEQLLALDNACFSIPWSSDEIKQELEHEHAVVLGFFQDNKIIGALLARIIIDEIWIFRIMVLPELRRKKIAHKLLQKVISPFVGNTDKTVTSLWIEVAKSNDSAIRFYESEGFLRVSSRLGYYAANYLRTEPEDAWVMCRKL